MTVPPAGPPRPNFYLERVRTSSRSVRSWIHRYTKRHPEDPEYREEPGVEWVLGVMDDLDRQLARAVESVDHHLPTLTAGWKERTEQTHQRGLNLHRLKVMTDRTRAMSRWVSTVRWSQGVKPGDLDQLDSLIRELSEHLGHLEAQAQEAELAE